MTKAKSEAIGNLVRALISLGTWVAAIVFAFKGNWDLAMFLLLLTIGYDVEKIAWNVK